ncbi:MAG: ribonuclease T2 family protein [Roseiarcus sp.]
MRVRCLAAALAALIGGSSAALGAPPDALVSKGDFDFYVLTLSWSPGFCDTGGAEKAREQCAAGAGEGFVVHGLWPENADRPYPSDCGQSGYIPSEALRLTHGLYPAEGLARYEYRTHGTCTGLTPESYFAAVKYARDRIVIPQPLQSPRESQSLAPSDIESAFIAANPNLTSDNFAVTCSHGELVDVRICIPKTLDGFVDCPKIARHTCHASTMTVAPLR